MLILASSYSYAGLTWKYCFKNISAIVLHFLDLAIFDFGF